MMEFYLLWVIGWFVIVVWGLWFILGYPIYAMLKHEKIQLRIEEISLEKLRLFQKGSKKE